MSADRPAAIVVGAGDHTGGAIARRFAREGFVAVPVRRNADKLEPLRDQIVSAGGAAVPIGCDARDEDQVAALFERVEREVGPVEVCVFNVGANVPSRVVDETARKYRKIWEMACFGGFLTGREAARVMGPRGRGTILFTGATASLRGAAGFAAFAGAKSALRSTAQSLAREMAPEGIHVAHVVIDGPIDTAFIRENFPQAYERGPDAVLDPDAIAETYWQLHRQPRSAWTFEIDLRPWKETW